MYVYKIRFEINLKYNIHSLQSLSEFGTEKNQ